jgi:alkylation response protein AidB-like acyl-CoA dehydrogenase
MSVSTPIGVCQLRRLIEMTMTKSIENFCCPNNIPCLDNVSMSASNRLSLDECVASVTEIADYCAVNAAAIDRNGAFPVREFKKISDSGLLAAPLMPEFGGLGLGIDSKLTHYMLQVLKKIGWGNLAVGRIYEGHTNALQLIQTFGTREQIQRYAKDARDNFKIFGVWNAEANDGVKVIPLDNGRYQLQGSKTFCSGSGYVERPFVNGTLPDGRWQMCVVSMEEVETVPYPDWWQPSGMRATASYKVDFSNVELNRNELIATPEDYNRQPWLTVGSIRFAAVQLGGAEALFDATRHYLHSLSRTNDAYQEARMGQMAIAIETGNLWLKGAAELIAEYAPTFCGEAHQEHPNGDRLVAYINMARTAIEQICMDVIQLCERSVGTRGLLPPYPMERIIRDLSLYLRQPGFDASLQCVGKYSLAHPQDRSLTWHEPYCH